MNTETFCRLAQHTSDAALTVLYALPTDTTPAREPYINSVVSQVRGALKLAGIDDESAATRVAQFEEEIRSERYRTASGIAYFDGGDVQHAEPIDVPIHRTVTLASSFTMAPLASLMGIAPQLFVMALSRGEWRLLRPGNGHVETMTVPDAPLNLAEANALFEESNEEVQHTDTTTSSRSGASGMHRQRFGHEAPDDKRDLRYVEALSRALSPVVGQTPVVLIGLAPLSSTFRDSAKLSIAAVDVVDPQDMSNEQLMERAQVLAPEDKALEEKFGIAESKGQVVQDAKTLMKQAGAGNIKVLVAPIDAQWVSQVSSLPASTPSVGTIDAVTVTMGAVLAHGGEVVTGNALAGIQRWPTSPVA
ncbi:MAG: hypothetical protein ACJATT_003075 [Myxococcota bacterium]|jgi:hypothetical protein